MQRLNPQDRQKIFDTICELAIAGNRRLLKELLKKHNITIGFRVQECTPVRRLAIDGHFAAVNFLITRFNASPNEALLGYGITNNSTQAQKLINDGISDKPFVVGLARGGHLTTLLNLKNILTKNIYRSIILMGSAMGGHINRNQLDFATAFHLNTGYIFGLAFSGQTEELQKELDLGASIAVAIWGFASAGAEHEVNARLNEIDKDEDADEYKNALSHAALGYATSGYIELAEEMTDKGANPTWRVCGYAKAGANFMIDDILKKQLSTLPNEPLPELLQKNQKLILDKLSGENIEDPALDELADKLVYISAILNEAAKGYANAYCPQQTARLFELGANPYSFTSELNGLALTEKDILHFQTVLSYVDNYEKRINLANRLFKDPWAMLDKTNKLNTLMSTYDLDYHAAQQVINIYKKPDIKTWLLQGTQVCKDHKQGLPILPFDIYLRVTVLVTGLPANDVKKIFDMVNDFLLKDVIYNQSDYHRITSSVSAFFGGKTFEQKAGIRHQERRLGFEI